MFYPVCTRAHITRHGMDINCGAVEACGNGPPRRYARQRIAAGVTPERVLFLFSVEKSPMKQFKRLSAFFLSIVFVSVLGCTRSATRESIGEHVTGS
jgi:hypothetical protein